MTPVTLETPARSPARLLVDLPALDNMDLWALRRAIDRIIEDRRLAAIVAGPDPEPPPAVQEIDCPYFLADPPPHTAKFMNDFR